MLGTAIQICESIAYEDACYTLVGKDDARTASQFVLVLLAAMLATSVLIVAAKTVGAIGAPELRLVSTGRTPSLRLPAESSFHGFFSHAWGTGQDQVHTIVRRLQQLLPGVRIWLDVDCVDDIGRLEESVADSATFLVFLSAGYFESCNCRRETYAALATDRPFIAVHEVDCTKGGASLAALRAECSTNCVDVAPPAHPSYSGPEEALAKIFGEPPVVWVRVHAFQLESLKAIALRMLRCTPVYLHHAAILAGGVAVPGQVGPHVFQRLVTIFVCRGNDGALNVAAEVAAAAREGRGLLSKTTCRRSRASTGTSTDTRVSETATVEVREADGALDGGDNRADAVLLLYLTNRIFLDESGAVARLVRRAIDQRIPFALVAEQDPARGGCPFRQCLQQTPQVLQQPPYNLYNTVAVPLFPSEHRKVSLRLGLRSMGAVPCDAGPLRRQWQLLRRHMAVARLVRRRPDQPHQELSVQP